MGNLRIIYLIVEVVFTFLLASFDLSAQIPKTFHTSYITTIRKVCQLVPCRKPWVPSLALNT